MKLKADIDPESITAIIDTREQLPLDLYPLKSEIGTLTTGDYSVKGLEHVICLERKSLTDLLGCIGGSRERFEKELKRMLAYETRMVIVECSWACLRTGFWDSKITAASAMGSVIGWEAMGIPFRFCEGYTREDGTDVTAHEEAGEIAAKVMFIAARRRWREARGFVNGIAATD